MHRYDEWLERMRDLVSKPDKYYNGGRTYVENHCDYGSKHFCDGTVNRTCRKPAEKNKPPCKYFIQGKCELRLHQRKDSRAYNERYDRNDETDDE